MIPTLDHLIASGGEMLPTSKDDPCDTDRFNDAERVLRAARVPELLRVADSARVLSASLISHAIWEDIAMIPRLHNLLAALHCLDGVAECCAHENIIGTGRDQTMTCDDCGYVFTDVNV